MSPLPDNEFDLEKLFLPAWAQEPSSAKYAHFEGEDDRTQRRGDQRGPRPPRRDAPPAQRRDDNRPRRDDRRGPPRPESGRNRLAPGGRGQFRRPEAREPRPAPPPLPEINLSLLPDEKGVESLARQIKMTGRAYPLFDIAQMILQKPERHSVVFSVKLNAEGKPVQPLFVCALDDTLWLSEDEAAAHVLRKHFATFYQAERTAKEPPKGTYTFVAQCGLSGVILGPPNYHDYQNQLRKLHAERFSRMLFDDFKARVRIVRDEEVVKKWIEEQSWRTEYNCLNLPEPLRLASMAEVETHFRQTHKENIIKPVQSHTLIGAAARALRSPELLRLIRSVWEDQRRFPLQIATVLSQQFAGHGLQFFKVNKAITHVCVTRPHYLDLAAAPVSEGVKRIVDHLNTHAKCTRRDLVEALAPSPPPAPLQIPLPTPSAPPQEAAPGQPPAPGLPFDANQPTPEQTVVIADLHWLIHQGHVIEFANGLLETAKKPTLKPPKPEPKPSDQTPAPESQPPAPEPPQPTQTPVAEAQPPPAAQVPSLETAAASPAAADLPSDSTPPEDGPGILPAPDPVERDPAILLLSEPPERGPGILPVPRPAPAESAAPPAPAPSQP